MYINKAREGNTLTYGLRRMQERYEDGHADRDLIPQNFMQKMANDFRDFRPNVKAQRFGTTTDPIPTWEELVEHESVLADVLGFGAYKVGLIANMPTRAYHATCVKNSHPDTVNELRHMGISRFQMYVMIIYREMRIRERRNRQGEFALDSPNEAELTLRATHKRLQTELAAAMRKHDPIKKQLDKYQLLFESSTAELQRIQLEIDQLARD